MIFTAFLRKKKRQPQKIWERQTVCFHNPGKNLGLSHLAIKNRKKADTPSRSDAGFPASQALPEQTERVQMAPRFSASLQALTKPKTRKKYSKPATYRFQPWATRCCSCSSYSQSNPRHVTTQKTPSASITESIPLQKKRAL